MSASTRSGMLSYVEWIPGVLAGVLSGWIGALVTGYAQQRSAIEAEAARSRGQHKRDMISNGRYLVQDALLNGWPDERVTIDWRYSHLRQHLASLSAAPDRDTQHAGLLSALDQLEREWKLT
jgi:hypothetical protein